MKTEANSPTALFFFHPSSFRLHPLAFTLPLTWLSLLWGISFAAAEELRVPANTAYIEPDAHGVRVDGKQGVTHWISPQQKVVWFGEIRTPGHLTATLDGKLPQGATSKLKLTVGNQSREATLMGKGTESAFKADFGNFEIAEVGYHRFTLESLNPEGANAGDLDALILDGPARKEAHFNLEPRRNAASVHLAYPTDQAKIEWFYCEVTAVKDPVATFYMACGFHRGYFGMQVNSPTERRIIFSVWDAGSGGSAQDRSKVAAENHVSLLAKGEHVEASVFGNEGTGGHSHLIYNWKTGDTQRFLLTAQPVEQTFTTYSGYFFHPEQKQWMLISRMKAPKDGGYLKGLHSFSENFGGDNGQLLRKALYGNQWIRTSEGTWSELTTASFSHDQTGKADRLDRFMGVEGEQFFLSHGGFVKGSTKFGERFTRPSTKSHPEIMLPD